LEHCGRTLAARRAQTRKPGNSIAGALVPAAPFRTLGVTTPVLAAPMAGGPSTPELVIAAARAGGLGFLAGGYRTAPALAEQIAKVRAAGVSFGVNLFAPNPVPVDQAGFLRYAQLIAGEGEPYGLDLAAAAIVEDDDLWHGKIDLLLADPVPVASFTFGIPSRQVIQALRRAGTLVAQTVTSASEARLGVECGADVLMVQACAAGGHSGTLTPQELPADIPLAELLAQVGAAVPVPVVAAGGIATAEAAAAAIRAGATAVAVGTVLLRAGEAGTTPTHRAALADPARRETVLTRAFTGRPARGLRNRFTDLYSRAAPGGYPALHHLTSPLRKAAAAAGDPERLHLWAGTGYRQATAEPAAAILARLAQQL
jgi:NAD(P)H-dependent flavin oxidoreductase YrpB (nitropropane dioxygenase family)